MLSLLDLAALEDSAIQLKVFEKLRDLKGNRLTGQIPDKIGDCINLKYLDLSLNSLFGDIPFLISRLKQLEELTLKNISYIVQDSKYENTTAPRKFIDWNIVTRYVPIDWPLVLISDIRGDNLTGTIPDSIGNCTSFEILDIPYNQIADKTPYNIGYMQVATLFMVDWVPIRVYRNHADKGVAFPRWQPMSVKVSLWDGNSWATRWCRDKINWSKGPFIASFRDYKIDGCVWRGNPRFCRGESSSNWWHKPKFSTLTPPQRRLFKWVRKYHLIYDYCQDTMRFQNNLPKECHLPKY